MIESATSLTHLSAAQITALLGGDQKPKPRPRRNPRRRHRFVGMGGEVRIGGPASVTTKRAFRTRLGNVHVTYATMRTARQAAHANRLNEELYGTHEVGPGT